MLVMGTRLTWEESVGTGTVYSWVEVVHPAHPALREFGPYMVALVELDDMPEIKLMGAVVDAPLGGTMTIGARVQVVFEQTSDDLAQPRWQMT